MILKTSVDRYNNNHHQENKTILLYAACIYGVNAAMVFIARCSLFFAALHFVAITSYYASMRLAKKKQQRTLNTIQLRFLG
jgi:hypothetical protein